VGQLRCWLDAGLKPRSISKAKAKVKAEGLRKSNGKGKCKDNGKCKSKGNSKGKSKGECGGSSLRSE
jgi:hypothetical protein